MYSYPISFKIFIISLLLLFENGSILYFILPSNKHGSWGIIVIFLRNKSNPIFDISSLSINIFPVKGSKILNKHKHIVLLPEPVLPTTPIFSFDWISIFKFFKTISVFGRYLTL